MKTLLEKIHARFAIVNRGFDQVNLRGSVGAVTYRRVGGETIASQKVPPKQTFKPTWALMYRRMLWPNLVALFRLLNVVGWHPSFMGKAPRVSDFNEFMRRNVSDDATKVFLQKPVAEAGGAVVAPVMVSRGDLPTINFTYDDEANQLISSLNVAALVIGASTQVSTFSEAIVENNTGFNYGDQLTVVICQQQFDTGDTNPRVKVTTGKVILDAESIDLLSDLGLVELFAVNDGRLALPANLAGGGTFIHSRDVVGDETRVSTQRIVMPGRVPQGYTSLQAFEAAADSYGGVRSAQYLTPRSGADEVFPQA